MTRLTLLCGLLVAAPLLAQDNYEIQVYGSDTVAKDATMVELHSNYTPNGLPLDDRALHETLEITHGITPWFETGFYVFTNAQSGTGWDLVGSHIRPRVRVPEEWHWPVGVSLSTEFGYIRKRFSEDEWTWEIRPIIDKELGRWYLSLNPAFETHFVFSPALNIKYDVTPKVAAGVEYYGGGGTQQIFPAIDLNVSPEWEFNAGVGFGLNHATDRTIFKVILGRRFK
ncbi:MAG TPA: hypothetical protein VL284_01690 [Thermoanaerobaculia bacterium]|nr:hypothetical protein [Thermoanaerobaculia bacterium]